jgi:hypothetical protein
VHFVYRLLPVVVTVVVESMFELFVVDFSLVTVVVESMFELLVVDFVALCKLENIKHKNSTFTYIQRMTIFQIATVTIHKFYELFVMLR